MLVVNAVLLVVLGAAVPVFIFSNGVTAKSVGWQEYMSPGGRYSIELPGDPKEKLQRVHTHSGPLNVNMVTVDLGKNGEYTTSYCDLSDFTQTVSDEELLDRILRGMLSKEKSEVLIKTPISIDSVNGLPAAKGLEVETQLDEQTYGKGNVSIARIYWVNERSIFYMNMATTQRSPENASRASKFLNSFRLVTETDIEFKFSDASGSSPLIDAAARGDLSRLTSLLDQGATQQDKDLALLKAVYAHKLGAVEQLTNAGANPNAKNLEGQTALMIAVVHADSCVPALIKAGADVNAQDPQHGWTPIMFSLIEGQGISVAQLIAARAYLNVKDEHGKTPLMHAVSYPKYKNLIPRLIEARADVNAKSKDGRSVLAFAKNLPSDAPERAAIVEVLIRAGAKE